MGDSSWIECGVAMSDRQEYYDLLNKAEMALWDVRKAFDFNINKLLDDVWKEGQQSILKQLKEYVKDGQLAEHYLDAVIEEKL